MTTDPDKLDPDCVSERAGQVHGTGHQGQVERLFHEHNQSLLRFLRSRAASAQEASEIAQEAYVRLLKLDNPGAVSFLQAYLFKTAANIATERFSQRRTRERCDQLIFVDSGQELTVLPPERQYAAQQELEMLRRAVEQLPRKTRTAFVLNRIEELSLDETATRMNLHPRHVRRLVADGLAHCLKILSGASGDAEGSR